MLITKKNDCFSVYPKNRLEFEFLEYISDSVDILVSKKEMNDEHEIRAYKSDKKYRNVMINKMEKGELVK